MEKMNLAAELLYCSWEAFLFVVITRFYKCGRSLMRFSSSWKAV